MARRNNRAVELVFSKGQTRNCHDWTPVKLPNGRIGQAANGKGVKYRTGKVVIFLASHPGSTTEAITERLQKLSDSYQSSDVSACIRQLRKAGCITSSGYGRATTYTLTSKGQAIWNNISKVFA